MSDVLLDIKNLRLSFFTPAGEVKALNDVTFKMHEGDVWASWARVEAVIRNCLFYNGPRSLSGKDYWRHHRL